MRSQVALLLFCMFFITALIQSTSGLNCYSCEGNDCSKTKECVLPEYRCYSATGKLDGNTVSMKGCANAITCPVDQLGALLGASVDQLGALLGVSVDQLGALLGVSEASVKCCEGNLCNGGETFTTSFLILLVPLLSSILLH